MVVLSGNAIAFKSTFHADNVWGVIPNKLLLNIENAYRRFFGGQGWICGEGLGGQKGDPPPHEI